MRNTHKNGPWQTFESCGETFIISAGDPSTADTVAKIWHAKYHPTRAQLIAAAPELLDVLAEIANLLATHPDAEIGNSKIHYAMHKARNAISIATGTL